ncbi:MAG: hypothetical protein ACO1TE_24330 [Prosthecobacter sp.]
MKSSPVRLLSQGIVLLAALSLVSCSSGTKYRPGSVSTAAISSHVELPKKMTFETRGSRWVAGVGAGVGGLAGGLVGAAIATGMVAKSDDEMREWYKQEVLKVLREEISARRQFQLVPEGQGQATVQVSSMGWGFMLKGMGGPFSGQSMAITPLMVVMKDSQGKVLWKTMGARDGSIKMKDIPSHKGSDLKRNPALMQQELAASVRRTARSIASTLPVGNAPMPAPAPSKR